MTASAAGAGMAHRVTGYAPSRLIRGIDGLRNQRKESGERVLAFAHDGPQARFTWPPGSGAALPRSCLHYYGNLREYQIDATVKHLFGQPQNIAARPPDEPDCLAATVACQWHNR
jgi:hypothetical protein